MSATSITRSTFGLYDRRKNISKNELGAVLHFIKKKIVHEQDEYKRQAWAEVGIELNRIYLHLGVNADSAYGK